MTRKSKQLLIVRKDLNMRKGKMGTQCAHASMKVLLDRIKDSASIMAGTDGWWKKDGYLTWENGTALADWIEGLFTKVCVSVNSEAELLDLREKAEAAGLPFALIQDSGATEFHGVPTYTVLAIGPAWADEIDPITRHLPPL